jgi:hypothetical protein
MTKGREPRTRCGCLACREDSGLRCRIRGRHWTSQ